MLIIRKQHLNGHGDYKLYANLRWSVIAGSNGTAAAALNAYLIKAVHTAVVSVISPIGRQVYSSCCLGSVFLALTLLL